MGAFLGGNYGAMVRIITGADAPRAPDKDALRTGTGATAATPTQAFAAFEKWLARAPALAAD